MGKLIGSDYIPYDFEDLSLPPVTNNMQPVDIVDKLSVRGNVFR